MKTLFSALLATAGVIGMAFTAQAQAAFSIGPRVGLNLSTISIDEPDSKEADPDNLLGYQVGVTASMQVANHFAIQPSLLLSRKGFKDSESETDTYNGVTTTYSSKSTAYLSYLELPLNFVYSTGETDGFQLFVGPYLALGVGGKFDYEYKSTITGNGLNLTNNESGSEKIEFANQEPNNSNNNSFYIRKMDAGLNGGLGYRRGPVQVQLGYGLGLATLVPRETNGSDSKIKAYNRAFQLTANYFFGAK